MTHIKINKALWASLIVASLMICSISIHQTLTWTNSSYATNSYSKSQNTYSDEVSLEAAPEYSGEIMEYKEKYIEIYRKVLWDKLDTMSLEKLELINDRLDTIQRCS